VAIYCELVATVGGCNSTLEKRKWEGELNEIIEVTISNDGTVQVLVKNTREDLLHDFQYFLQESKQHDPNAPESMFLHARFLRAALLTLFAYAEAVVNGWVHALLEQRDVGVLFARIQRDCLDKKIEVLNDLSSMTLPRPKLNEAKEVRNLFVHFTPTEKMRHLPGFRRLSSRAPPTISFVG
jgi:hypothetical protein